MFEEVKGRPIYLIKDALNMSDSRFFMEGFPRWRGSAYLEKQAHAGEDSILHPEEVKAA
jgi:hypothetical protein